MASDGNDRRKETRASDFASVQFHLDSHHDNEIISGVVRDTGDSGICMYTMYSLTEGQIITFKDKTPKSNQRATVRWVKNYGNFYKVGLELEGAPSAISIECLRPT